MAAGRWCALGLAALLLAACGRASRNPGMTGMAGSAGSAADGSATGGSATGGSAACCSTPDCSCDTPPPSSHGMVPMHRLRGVEYRNSIADTLGVAVQAPVADEPRPFEAIIYEAEPWFEASKQVAQALFDRDELPEPLGCVGAAEASRDCALSVIDELGLRLFRRPLLEAERSTFVGLYDELGVADGTRVALEQVVRALLLSPAFLFHVELSDDPDGTAPERLDSYALAARLSFALWSTTPDPALLAAAEADLTGDTALGEAYERLATDERALALPDGWGEVWLGVGALGQHAVASDVFPSFNAELRIGMQSEQRELLRQYWLQPVPLVELPTLDLSYVDAPLSQHYGFQPGQVGFVSSVADERIGLLGQAALLTLTSLERRVSASHRGRYVVETLLCRKLPAPPPGEAGSLGADFPVGVSEREALNQSVGNPTCQGCHSLFDPVGLALANFDAIGAYRAQDSQGHAIDAQVQLPESTFAAAPVVNGLPELGEAIADSRFFRACVSQQLASYLVHRDITEDTDADLLWPLVERVAAQASLTELTERIVMSDHFRYRRLAPTP